MDVPVHIGPASQEDYEWCARLMVSTEPWITLQRNFEGCRATLTRPGTELFLARDENESPLGFILLAAYGFAAAPYIACFAVSADARGRGVGAQLLAFAEERYRDRQHLFLLVSSFNERAQQFYRRHGFEFIGDLKDYIVPRHSELIFHKRLP
jgi:ribosomal-protein-alanine N-acetyltransferase